MYRKIGIWVLCMVIGMQSAMAAQYSVKMQEEVSGNKHVYATVDGMKVRFTFDTGCSSLTLNKQLFDELVKKGVVKESELSEPGESELANGETHLVRYFTIKRLQLGNYVMRDVRASVGIYDHPDADPLLGQSVLGRLESYTISKGMLVFEPKSEAEQQALSLASAMYSDTARAVQNKIVQALKPYENRLSPRYQIIYGHALEFIDEERQAIPLYQSLLRSDAFEDVDGKIYQRMMNAKVNYAEQLYQKEAYGECETLVKEIIRESQQEPVYTRGLDYSYNTLCYIYWQTKEYDKAEQATLQYCNYLLSPRTWEWLENHAMEADENIARLLNHLSQYCSYNKDETKANRYAKMAKNAGWKE